MSETVTSHGSTITLCREPGSSCREFPRPKTVGQLLSALCILEETALVIRDGQLLTPDQHIYPDQTITVRSVISTG